MSRAVKKVLLRDVLRRLHPEISKDRLFAMLHSGEISVNGQVERDGSARVSEDAEILVSGRVSSGGGRGRHKLQAALDTWQLPVSGLVWLDAGASTGGFTACLLDNGAAAVHAVDVGYNQLDYKLRIDDRVHVWERCNIMQPRNYAPQPHAFCMDLSFRSALQPILTVLPLCQYAWGVVLLKPQFEWKDPPDWFNGVVPEDHVDGILSRVLDEWRQHGVYVLGTLPSPIRGKSGNQEYLVLISLEESLRTR